MAVYTTSRTEVTRASQIRVGGNRREEGERQLCLLFDKLFLTSQPTANVQVRDPR